MSPEAHHKPHSGELEQDKPYQRDGFLLVPTCAASDSRDHRRLHRILERGDPFTCTYCGTGLIAHCINPWEYRWVWKNDRWVANTPGVANPPRPYTIEHVMPRSRGGVNALWNLGLACDLCNERKADSTMGEFFERWPTIAARYWAKEEANA